MLFLLIIITVLIIYIYIISKKTNNLTRFQELEKELLYEKQRADEASKAIENIAHQWKQPLNSISAICCHLNIKSSICDKLDKEIYTDGLTKIDNQSQYLSQTIDVFRNHINRKNDYQNMVLQNELRKVFSLLSGTLDMHNINVIDSIDYELPLNVRLIDGELSQVITNIVYNARDAMKQNNAKNPTIKYNLIKRNDFAIITIEDNGGGIAEDIISKIFEPYFTTKDAGLGIGLNMSYKIVTQSLKGKIYALNTTSGAKFFIELAHNF